MSWDEWRKTPWHEQRALLEYLDEMPDSGFGLKEGGAVDELPPELAPQRRTVDVGTDVIDLTAMRAELEAERARMRGGR